MSSCATAHSGVLLTFEFLDEEAGGQHASSAGDGDGDVVVEAKEHD